MFATTSFGVNHSAILLFNNQCKSLSLEIIVMPCSKDNETKRTKLCKLFRSDFIMGKGSEYFCAEKDILIDSSYYLQLMNQNDEVIKQYIVNAIKNSSIIELYNNTLKTYFHNISL